MYTFYFLEVITHECEVHGFQLQEEKAIRLESKKKKDKRTYKISTGRPTREFANQRLYDKYFDVQLLNFNESTGQLVRSPALCIGEALDAFRSGFIRQHVKDYYNV